jgi:hypothetical protein
LKIYDCHYSLCSGDSYLCLLDFGVVSMARVSGLQPIIQNPQSQTTSLKFYASRHFNTSERFALARRREAVILMEFSASHGSHPRRRASLKSFAAVYRPHMTPDYHTLRTMPVKPKTLILIRQDGKPLLRCRWSHQFSVMLEDHLRRVSRLQRHLRHVLGVCHAVADK